MWTEQTVETLRRFASEGKSAAWIAVALGAPSRNAVIGKANRIGIKLSGATGLAPYAQGSPSAPPLPQIPWGRKTVSSTKTEPRSERRAPEELARRGATRARSRGTTIAHEKARADRRIYAAAEVGEMRRIGLAEIGEIECRWPVGDPLGEDFAYCGLPIARRYAYCAGHYRLAYRMPSDSRR